MSTTAVPGTDTSYCLLHLTDTHLLAAPGPNAAGVDPDDLVAAALDKARASGIRPDAVLLTGDLADDADPDAYRRLRAMVEPFADELGAQLLLLPGNHDAREPFREHLLGVAPSALPIHGSIRVRGLRIVGIDTTLAEWHHGLIEPSELEWLANELAEPAPDGTVLAMHHPPLPTRIRSLQVLELQEQDRLAEIVSGSDVRLILAGHLHYPTAAVFAGAQVFASGAVSTFIDPGLPADEVAVTDGFQSFSIVTIDGTQVTTAVTPIQPQRRVGGFGADFWGELEPMDAIGRLERFSRKR